MNGQLYAVIGLPRSGKSTFANKWLLQGRKPPRVVVSGDDIRLSLTGNRYNYLTENVVHASLYLMVRTLLHKHDVLIDETNTSYNSIKQILSIQPTTEFFVIDTPPDVCKERAIKDKQEDVVVIIDKLLNNLQHLTGFYKPADIFAAIHPSINIMRYAAITQSKNRNKIV